LSKDNTDIVMNEEEETIGFETFKDFIRLDKILK
jgi:hypothetical protein